MKNRYFSSYTTSSNQYIEDEEDSDDGELMRGISTVGLTAGGIYGANKLFNNNAYIQSLNNKERFTGAIGSSIPGGKGYQAFKATSNLTLGDVMLNVTHAIENASPFHILRTFGISESMMPFTLGTNTNATISARSVSIQAPYLEALLKTKGSSLTPNARAFGIKIINGDVYELTDNGGTLGKKIFSGARLAASRFSHIGDDGKEIDVRMNKTVQKMADIIGARNFSFKSLHDAGEDGITLVSDNKWTYAKAFGRARFETAINTVAKPIDHVLEPLGNNKFVNKARSVLSMAMDSSESVPRQLARYSGKALKLSLYTAAAYKAADVFSRLIAPEDSAFDKGIIEGVATTAINARLAYAKIIGDSFQGYRDTQEYVAPGSTSLMTLAGFGLAGAMTAGIGIYGQRVAESVIYGTDEAAKRASHQTTMFSQAINDTIQSKMGKFTPKMLLNKYSRAGRYARIGAMTSSLFALPFIPGALIGEDSEELEDVFSGRKEVAIKSNRWWFSGSTRYEGEKTKYYTQHWYARLMSGAKDKSLYGDSDTARDMNPLYNPFDYMSDPYKFERMHQKDRPYPIWGMEVSAGSVLGKVFERTVGQIIKPDMLNPDIKRAQETFLQYQQDKIESADSSKIASEINKFRESQMMTQASRDALAEDISRRQEESSKDQGKLSSEHLLSQLSIDSEKARLRGGLAEIDMSKFDMIMDDADTVILRDKSGKTKDIEIRLSGMDSPETAGHENDPIEHIRYNQKQLYGQESTKILEEIVSKNKNMKIVINKGEMTYGRYIGALVDDEGNNVNLQLLQRGAGSALPWGSGDMISKRDVMAAEKEAKASGEGIWDYSRYKAFSIFSELTGQRQTFNTFTRLDKLAERPEIAEFATFMDSLGKRKGELTDEEIQRIKDMSVKFLYSQQDYKDATAQLKRMGIGPGQSGIEGSRIADEGMSFTQKVTGNDKSLIAEGKMTAPLNAVYNPAGDAISWSGDALADFMGLQGFVTKTALEAIAEGDQIKAKQMSLSRSGEAVNPGRSFADLNLGGAMGLTEAQRRLMPTSKTANPDTVNPIRNQMPQWLPANMDNFYIDFSTGDPYTKIENGMYRLPGAGYEAMHPELQGFNPEDYPDIYKYKILSDVALGSREYYNYKNKIEKRAEEGRLTEYEQSIYNTVREQEIERSRKKKFSDPKTKEEMEGISTGWRAIGKAWEFGAYPLSEGPLDSLTFFRPGGKLVHNRTAIQDYKQTMVLGTDTAIWTKPKSEFIDPAINKAANLVTEFTGNGTFIPEEKEEQRSVNSYFDRLEYVKQRRLYKEAMASGDERGAAVAKAAYQRTRVGAISSGLDESAEVNRAYSALGKEEKPYFGSFMNADGSDRDVIRDMTSSDVSAIYESLWTRKDAIENNPDMRPEEIMSQISKAEEEKIIASNPGLYKQYQDSNNSGSSFREYIADVQAEQYIKETTGMPDDSFEGWDPRIDTKDIKLRTLIMGGEDIHNYGFWESDVDRLARMKSVLEEDQVMTQMESIKSAEKQRLISRDNTVNMLYNQGYDVRSVKLSRNPENHLNLSVESE